MTDSVDYEKVCKALVAKCASLSGALPFKVQAMQTFLSPYELEKYKEWKLEVTNLSDPWTVQVELLSPEYVRACDEKRLTKKAIYSMLTDAGVGILAASNLTEKLVGLLDNERKG